MTTPSPENKPEAGPRKASLLEECEEAISRLTEPWRTPAELKQAVDQAAALLDRLRPICEDRRTGRTVPVKVYVVSGPAHLHRGDEPITEATVYARVPDPQPARREEGEP